MKKKITSTPAYRKVVADLHDCEERYGSLVESIGVTDNSKLASAVEALRAEVRQRRRLEGDLLTAIEEERRRIGQDLHDDLCQRLGATAMLTASLVKQISAKDSRLGAELAQIPGLINDTIDSCRELARGLHPVTLVDKGLPAALQELAARIPPSVKFRWSQRERVALEPSVALHLYRIAEEGVGNAVKHSKATKIWVEFTVVRRRPALVISDNGKGFEERRHSKGMGLNNMRYRARVIGGELSIVRRASGGTRVRCHLPLPKD